MKKLPEVGKEYRDKKDKRRIVTFIGIYKYKDKENLVCVDHGLDGKGNQITSPNNAFFYSVDDFWKCNEEIPKEKLTKDLGCIKEMKTLSVKLEKLNGMLEDWVFDKTNKG